MEVTYLCLHYNFIPTELYSKIATPLIISQTKKETVVEKEHAIQHICSINNSGFTTI